MYSKYIIIFIIIVISITRNNDIISLSLHVLLNTVIIYDYIFLKELKISESIVVGIVQDYFQSSILGFSSFLYIFSIAVIETFRKYFNLEKFHTTYGIYLFILCCKILLILVIHRLFGYYNSFNDIKKMFFISLSSYPILYLICGYHLK